MRLVLVLLMLSALTVNLGLAQDSELIRQREEEVSTFEQQSAERQAELERIAAELGATKGQLDAQIAARDTLSQDLNALQTERAALQTNIETVRGDLAAIDASMGELEADVSSLKGRVSELLVSLYKQRGGRLARAIGQADSLQELRIRNHYLSLLTKRDLALIEDLGSRTQMLADTQAAQTALLAELTQQEQALTENEILLGAKQGELDNLISELNATEAGQLAQQASVLEEAQRLEARIREAQLDIEAEQARLEAEAEAKRRELEAANTQAEREERQEELSVIETRLAELGQPLPALQSNYIYPVAGATLFSQFRDNNSSSVSLRTDEANAVVQAAQSGRVIFTTSAGTNTGFLVTIEHADGIQTTYANLRADLLVSEGNTVEQGDAIGYLGGSSLLPGNILQFYTSQGGDFVNPADVLGF